MRNAGRAGFSLGLVLALGACTTTTTTASDAGVDVPTVDVGVDGGAADRPVVDASHPTDVVDVPDVAVAVDVVAVDVVDVADVADARDAPDVVDVAAATDAPTDAATCDPAVGCHAFWCGCGRCNPNAITCVSGPRGCPLGCVASCPEVETATCACTGGSCGAPVLAAADAGTDAGTDAGPDAGGLAAGQECASDGACAPGLLCCYPCGIPGCTNRCGPPQAGTNRCPLFP